MSRLSRDGLSASGGVHGRSVAIRLTESLPATWPRYAVAALDQALYGGADGKAALNRPGKDLVSKSAGRRSAHECLGCRFYAVPAVSTSSLAARPALFTSAIEDVRCV